tara:strand:+ start:237 stop:383 length:147 start_codon:yes stop_codon:yes gene_type:complete
MLLAKASIRKPAKLYRYTTSKYYSITVKLIDISKKAKLPNLRNRIASP